jgi:AraC-like DNA-binding protein
VGGMLRGDRELTFVRSSALRGVELVAATFRGLVPPPLLLSQLALVWCEDEAGAVDWGRPVQALGPGEVLLQAPNQVATLMRQTAPETRCRMVLIEPALLPAPAADQRWLAPFAPVVTRMPDVVVGVRALWDAVATPFEPPEQQARLAMLLGSLDGLIGHDAPPPPPLTPAVARTRATLHERYADDLHLDELAAIAGMSKCHLVHLFHKEVGLPPHAYQIQLRVARARELVTAGVPLAAVAAMTGFADQSHLTRLFKRVVGVPPGRYAAAQARAARTSSASSPPSPPSPSNGSS